MIPSKTAQMLKHSQKESKFQKWMVLGSVVFFFACFYFIEVFALPAPAFPMIPTDQCLAFISEEDCPLTDRGCSPCDGTKCPCPCPKGVCSAGVVGPCPGQSDTEPAEGYGNPASVGGPVCKDKVESPGGPDNLCPTGVPAVAWNASLFPPTFKLLDSEAYCKEICPANLCGKGAPSSFETFLFDTLPFFDCFYVAVAITYTIFNAPRVFGMKSGKMKNHAVTIYLIICYQFLAWYPHIKLHNYLSSAISFVVIDTCFHIPYSLTSLFLLHYVYKMFHIMSNYTHPTEGLRKYFCHPALPSAIVTLICVCVVYPLFYPYGILQYTSEPFWNTGITAFWIINSFLECCLMAIAFSFVFFAVPLVRSYKEKNLRCAAYGLIVAFFWNIGSWFFHIWVHNVLPVPWLPRDFLLIDFCFHYPTHIASWYIAYHMNSFIRMASSMDKSEKSRSRNRSNASRSEYNKSKMASKAEGASRFGGSQITSVEVPRSDKAPVKDEETPARVRAALGGSNKTSDETQKYQVIAGHDDSHDDGHDDGLVTVQEGAEAAGDSAAGGSAESASNGSITVTTAPAGFRLPPLAPVIVHT